MIFARKSAVRILAAAVALTGATAAAQQPPPRPAPAPHAPAAPKTAPAPQHSAQAPATAAAAVQEPQRTTATYGDWVLRCEILPGPPVQKNCDMEQLAQVQGQTNPISRVAIPLPPKGEAPKLFVQLPVNASFAAPIKIMADGKDAGVTTPFRRCVPAGCFGELDLKDDLQKKFRAAGEPGKIVFNDASDHEVAIPLSFKGFGQAYEALFKQ
jgi:invasion protein IalB